MLVPQKSHATCPNCQNNFGHMSTQMSGSMQQLWSVCRSQIYSHFRNFTVGWWQNTTTTIDWELDHLSFFYIRKNHRLDSSRVKINLFLLWTQISNFGHFGHFDFGHKSTQKPWPMPQLWCFTLATSPRICGTSTGTIIKRKELNPIGTPKTGFANLGVFLRVSVFYI